MTSVPYVSGLDVLRTDHVDLIGPDLLAELRRLAMETPGDVQPDQTPNISPATVSDEPDTAQNGDELTASQARVAELERQLAERDTADAQAAATVQNPGDGGVVSSPGADEPEAPAEPRKFRDLWNTLVTRLGHHDLHVGEDEELS